MPTFPIHTIESAPEKSKPMLQGLKNNFGFVPNAAATMAGSPALIGAFVSAFGSFHGSSFNEAEKQVLLLTNAVAALPGLIAARTPTALLLRAE